MFKLELEPTFEATVEIPRPGGNVVPVRVTFNYLDADAYQEAWEACRGKPLPEWVNRLVAGWEEQDDPAKRWQGMPMPYSLEALRTLARHQPRALAAFTATYHHEALGLPLKN